jgi:hypothetical protein
MLVTAIALAFFLRMIFLRILLSLGLVIES